MGRTGFFTRVESKAGIGKGKRELPLELVRKMGVRAAANMNPRASHPDMPAKGSSSASIYVLGEAPGEEEDRRGEPFVGPSGSFLRRRLRDAGVKSRLSNVVRTRPPKNRKPNVVEIEAFRESTIRDIEKTKPRVIIAVGNVALRWFGIKSGVRVARGRRFPVRVGSHSCWMFPVVHPSYILRLSDGRDEEGLDREEWERVFGDDIYLAVKGTELAEPEIVDIGEEGRIEYVCGSSDLKRLISFVRHAKAEGGFTFDLETSRLRPYSGGRILCYGLATGRRTLVVLADHKKAKWSKRGEAKRDELLWELFTSGLGAGAHNLPFDLEWIVFILGRDLAFQSAWECTQAQAYVLDERLGGHSLDFLCRQHLGLALKSLSKVYLKDAESAPVDELLLYCGRDAKYTHQLREIQSELIERAGLDQIYIEQVGRVPALVLAQNTGLPICAKTVDAFDAKYTQELEDIVAEFRDSDPVRKYEARYGSFNIASSAATAKLFRDILHRKEGTRGKGYSTDRSALSAMTDEPLAAILLQYRRIAKLLGTYVHRFHLDHERTYVFSDGRIHPVLKPTATRSGRLASEDPNGQNFPKRRDRQLRSIIAVPPGHLLLSSDYGQIEARVMGMASRDKSFCAALRNNLDVHMEWAEKIASAYPTALKRRGGDMKKFRNVVKGDWVFASFFGSGAPSISRRMDMPLNVTRRLLDEFWEEFAGVKRWQTKLQTRYDKYRYVETLTGRRRHAPLSYNMRINTPVQGTASDIVVNAMLELAIMAYEEDKPWLAPVLNIHDDLTHIVPVAKKDEAIECIVTTMTKSPARKWDWVNVPISVEVEEGSNWFEMETVGEYSSDKL